jgi:predicted nucleic-acid-binding Zn-ribbon protein
VNDQPKDDPTAQACPKCGGNWLDCTTSPGNSNSSHFRLYPADGSFLSFWRSSTAKALVCERCGYTELYAINPNALKPKH